MAELEKSAATAGVVANAALPVALAVGIGFVAWKLYRAGWLNFIGKGLPSPQDAVDSLVGRKPEGPGSTVGDAEDKIYTPVSGNTPLGGGFMADAFDAFWPNSPRERILADPFRLAYDDSPFVLTATGYVPAPRVQAMLDLNGVPAGTYTDVYGQGVKSGDLNASGVYTTIGTGPAIEIIPPFNQTWYDLGFQQKVEIVP